MEKFFVNVIVGEDDGEGRMNEYSCCVYKFYNWEEAAAFAKLSLENELIVEMVVPKEAREEQCR